MKKNIKYDTLAVFDNFNFCDTHTYTQTDGENTFIDNINMLYFYTKVLAVNIQINNFSGIQ